MHDCVTGLSFLTCIGEVLCKKIESYDMVDIKSTRCEK